MSHRLFPRASSAAAAAALALLATGPAYAADPIARASATALQVSVAGHGADSGTFTATNDGTRESTSGTNSPAVPALAGQRATNLGTLAQDAAARVADGHGHSAACAGIAGQGATLAQVGDGTSCLTGGQTVTMGAATADFSHVQVAPDDIDQGIDTTIAGAVSAAAAPVVNQLLDALGSPTLGLDVKAVQASCAADPGTAGGTASIADGTAYLAAPAPLGRVDLVSLPVHPAPNTHVLTDMSKVVTAVEEAVAHQLDTALGGSSGPLASLTMPAGMTVATVLDQVKANVTDALGPQLAPLDQNVLDIELNKQSRPSAGAIDVTALDLSVLPAAQQFVDADLASLVVGHVTCGPSGRLAAPAAAPALDPSTPADAPVADPPADTAVPTAVKSGAASFEDAPSALAIAALAGLVLAGTGAGVWGFRRSLRS
ncbi:hypothetical protein [Nocardioides sp. AN3]